MALLRWHGLVALLPLVGGARAARADQEVVAWTAPAGCPDAALVRADVARLGGVAREGARASVVVTSQGSLWTASIILAPARVREISARSCAALAEAAALVVAMAFRDAPEEPATTVEPVAPPPRPAGIERPDTGAPRTPSSSALAVGAGFHGLAGALPSAAPGAGVWVAWLPGLARLELSAYGTTVETVLAPGSALGAQLQLLGASARACWMGVTPLGRNGGVSLGPCAGLEGLRVASGGVGLTQPRDAVTLLGAGEVGVLLTLEPLAPRGRGGGPALTLSIDALAPTARPRFVIDGDPLTVLHRPAAVWGRVLVGGEIRF
jgi:hypothetical protein